MYSRPTAAARIYLAIVERADPRPRIVAVRMGLRMICTWYLGPALNPNVDGLSVLRAGMETVVRGLYAVNMA